VSVLAYVFWHWKRPGVAVETYQQLHRAFLQALTATPPAGLTGSTTYAISGAPWADGGADAWEDWYHLRSMGDLEALDQAAISASRQVPHDSVAAVAQGGTAGIYRLKAGEGPIAARYAWWFAKPAGMKYPELFAALAPLCAGGRGALWMRQMTLGPATEFCLHAAELLALPEQFTARRLDLRRVFP
jgi:hypothetical protein